MSSSDETTGTGDAMRLLESLTPGGSEFHENPERCAEWVQERLDSAQRLTVRAYTERNEMRQENARLRERVAALEGPADAAGAWMVLAVGIAEDRRVLSADLIADGKAIVKLLAAALAQADETGGAR